MLPTSRLAIRESVTTMAEKSVLTEMAMAWSNRVDNPPGYFGLRRGRYVRDRCAFWSESKGRSLHKKTIIQYNAATAAADAVVAIIISEEKNKVIKRNNQPKLSFI